jgi:glucose/mannose-6-phosphate isomerase
MIELDNQEAVRQLDKKNYYSSVEEFPRQCEQAWEEVKTIPLPPEYGAVENIVVCGMGGSGLGSWVIDSLFADRLKVPFEVVNDYTLPLSVNEKTLVVLSSYSGTTEEVLTAFEEAYLRRAKCLGIAAGGTLADLMRERNLPFYLIDPKHNPAGQPRAGVGYSIMGIVGMLAATGLVAVSDDEIKKVISALDEFSQKYSLLVPEATNLAKQIAQSLKEKIIILVGAEHLSGSLRVFRNQLQETAKNFADFYLLPELNHHLMEGLSFPKNNPQNLTFLFFDSALYSPRIGQKMTVTKDVVTQNKIPFLSYQCQAAERLSQAFEAILFGAYVSFYLAMLNEVDPSVIPWVDYFKEKLKD